MNTLCNQVQEKNSCSQIIDASEVKHLAGCSQCQNIFADYQAFSMLLAEDFEHFEVPANFADKVMLSIEDSRNQADWFESLGQIVSRFMEIPIVQYASLVTGFSAGIISFIRFVAFVFIPA